MATDLLEIEHAHRHVLAALDDSTAPSVGAVTWASAHLAVVERALYPLARTLPDGARRVQAQRAVDRRLQLALWRLDRRLTGDVHLRGQQVRDLEDAVRSGLEEHAAGERSLVAELCATWPADRISALDEALAKALVRAPTRPHPDTAPGLLGGLAFHVEGLVDRARDTLDSRHVPTPHPVPSPRARTRWGSYVLGAGSHDGVDEAGPGWRRRASSGSR